MRSLWWLLALALLVSGATAAYMLKLVMDHRGVERIGDGHDPRSYGFSFQPLLVDEASLVGSNLARDGLDVLDLPPRYGAEEATGYRGRDKYVVSGDLVVGVSVAGRHMAYPLQILNWHEVVNDTLGGVPIVVSYSPLAGLVAAFDRRIGDQTLEFGLSGILFNNHHLLYDRQAAPADPTRVRTTPAAGESPSRLAAESLWSPLLGQAVAGPAALREETLTPVEVELVPWKAWSARFPGTDVLARNDRKIMAYRRAPYGTYNGNDKLRFPAQPLPDRTGRRYKTRCLALEFEGRAPDDAPSWVVFDLEEARRRADPRGIWETVEQGVELRFQIFDDEPVSARVDRVDGQTLVSRPSFWFAWYACRPDDPIR